jgi:hypothetical protein
MNSRYYWLGKSCEPLEKSFDRVRRLTRHQFDLQDSLEEKRRKIADETKLTEIEGSAITALIHCCSHPVLGPAILKFNTYVCASRQRL